VPSLTDNWNSVNAVSTALRPLSWLYRGVIAARRAAYAVGLLRSRRFRVPVIVVGNLTVGGTGKTPLVIWIVELLQQQGYRPAIVSRGYRGRARHWPQQVRPDSDPVMVGDEAVVLARRCRCPIAVGPDRAAAVDALLQHSDCDVIVSDDGLQHYGLARDIEIAVVDGVRRFGNGFCLPAGPLREPVSRLDKVDFTIVNGGAVMRREYPMTIGALALRNVRDDSIACRPDEFPERDVHAVAGIGHPARFFQQLKQLGFTFSEHPFPDHHPFRPADLRFDDARPVVMTEKDAVKCRRFCADDCWYLAIEARPDPRVGMRLLAMLGKLAPSPHRGDDIAAIKQGE
jgi:tetraacyldisaccharide 4'-kinase